MKTHSYIPQRRVGRPLRLACASLWLAMTMSAVPMQAAQLGQNAAMQQDDGANYVKGVVVDKKTGETIPGVSVAIMQGGNIARGATADLNGKYNIPYPMGDFTVRFTYVGYKPLVLKKSQLKPGMTVELEEEAKEMEQVVVNGYFSKKKESFTGSVKQISGPELKQVSSTNIITAISALTPGLQIVQNNQMGSNPNHTPELLLRGTTSFSNEGQDVNQPTIILDGVEISMQDLYDLDMNEVESINVLKDAAATALYGSKAANGVIVISRKPIQESTLHIAYNFTGNVQFPVLRDYDMLNASEKLAYEKMAGLYTAPEIADKTQQLKNQWELDQLYNERYKAVQRGQNSDWMSQPARNSFSHDHSLRIYGGASNLRYELTGRFGDTKGVMKGDYRKRYNLGFLLSYYVKDALSISNRTSYAEVSTKDSPYGSFSQYTLMNPYDAMYNADGTVNTNLAWDKDNPLYEALLGSYSKTGSRTLTNTTDIRWDINKKFRVTAHFDIATGMGWGEDFTSPDSKVYKNETDLSKRGSMWQTSSRTVDYSGNIIGAYNQMFKDQSLLSLTGGWEINHDDYTQTKMQAIGFYSDRLSYVGSAAGYPEGDHPYGSLSESADVGFFLNGAYSFRNRYYVDGTYRATGSSQFGENNRFGHFWAAGAAWNILNEKFMKNAKKHFDLLKIRGSVGFTGKVSFSPFQALTMYEYSNDLSYITGMGAVPITIGNVDLSWERTLSYNVGVDLSMFDRRLNVTLDAYMKRTKDLLLEKSKAPSTGVSSVMENMGEIENKGIEYQIDGYIFRNRKFYWKLGTMGAFNKNRILKINSALEEMNRKNQEMADSYSYPLPQYAEGEPVSALKLVRSAGIDPATGKEIYIKRNGEYTFDYDPNDKVLIGDTEPLFTGSVSTSVYYKGFSSYALLSMRCGAWQYNTTRATRVEGSDPQNNADQRVFDDRWKQPGDVAIYKDIADTSQPKQTDRFAEKENTFTLTSLNLSYEFNKDICRRLHMRNLRVGVNFTDLFRLSTVKMERGTQYLYSQGFEITLSTIF